MMARAKGTNPGDLPTGQHWIKDWPVRTAELLPDVDPESWTLEITGEVGRNVNLTFKEIQVLGAVEIVRDFHCVESWSVPQNKWRGVPVGRILERANPLPDARYAVVSSIGGYGTNLLLEVLLRPDTLLVWECRTSMHIRALSGCRRSSS
jgi:DMSO/TMAO reductase YedYZ molybdopterin-dependent catalytic subunit